MRHGLSLLTLGIGWVLLTVGGGCTDESTTNNNSGKSYCAACSDTSECSSGYVCRSVATTLGVCAKASDTMCCDGPNGVGGHCHSGFGANLGSGGSAGGSILGTGGSAGHGTGGTGGATGGTFGSGGTGNTTSTGSNLGRACVKDTDCADAKLTCVTNDGINGDGPAKGMCTASCTSDSDCLDVADNSYCVPFSANGDMHCVEGCTEGSAGVPKCHEREEVACSLVGLALTSVTCSSTSDCNTDELCDSKSGQCGTFVTGCLPTCGGDYDCGDGQFCDFSSGFCVAQKPSGLPLGSPCTVPPANGTDPCDGFCLAGAADPTKGTCSALCTLNSNLTGCGWDGKGAAENACLFATILSGSDAAQGDVGLCGPLCDCNAQCTLKGEYCVDESMGQVSSIWGRQGYCRQLQQGETVASNTFSTCPAGSTGGTGGTTSTGNAGEAGQSSGGKGGTSGSEAGAGAGGQGGT